MTATRLSFPRPGIALLALDLPEKSANILSREVLEEIESRLDELTGRDDVRALVLISAKPEIFIAGADLREFAEQIDLPQERIVELCQRGQSLFRRFSQTAFPTVVAIHGVCVGGGAELSSWCDRRIVTDAARTEIGFPEVKLGLYPGWGGTVRVPRLVGLSNALEMITGGESLSAKEAFASGWATHLCPPDKLEQAALDVAEREAESKAYLQDRKRWAAPLKFDETELGFLGATFSAIIQEKTAGQYPAPLAALELMGQTAYQGEDEALALEAQGMAKLFGSPVNRALLNLFFLTDRNKKDRGVEADLAPPAIKRLGVVGAGIMGSGICGAALRRGVPVSVVDAQEDSLDRGARQAIEEASFDKALKGPAPQKALEHASHLHQAADVQSLRDCDLVIEAIVEAAEPKKALLTQLESIVGENAFLGSNTSTLPITELAKPLKRPERFVGIHFFNPVRRMKLVEVIRGEKTSPEAIAMAVAFAKRLGKMPVVVNDGPGFLVNRLLFPYMNEALALLSEGVPMKEIERAAKSYGMPMGPLELYDMVGLDTALYAGKTVWQAFPDRIVLSPILPAMVKSGRLGMKNGKGFFAYGGKKNKPQPDPDAEKLLDTYRKPNGSPPDRETLVDRLILPMLLEAVRALDANIVRDPRDVDLGMVFGLGFPPFRGGLLFWADSIGADGILKKLAKLEACGPRFAPPESLVAMAREGKTFYADAPVAAASS
ncbi:MAG TPA: 3-hydroxyacyl-CoA dehydrogenase NAD-binding domain-containing protein [Pirellulaceae bacterium]|jgi:3-hydroxyacyl-CoA dehydrogenase/enoyl-CoA hydratase/3-hydroxybutyryl-CoA epimerase/3-hydroxyacyl-CoA dehydrogenase/enoyl-CoA hydratase/3-hydroxybutyryl-CoA epimerase/enoyl-CoA isomerase|nr:3-hydroxyacyl-CoA dehydrogenase NAD-binding domain-containing protein [Pirellulaceae bacterium]